MTMISKMSEGLGRTCAIFFLTLLFALPLGLMVAKLRMSKNKVVSAIMKAYISILRGTPLMLQLLAVTYGPYYLSCSHLTFRQNVRFSLLRQWTWICLPILQCRKTSRR